MTRESQQNNAPIGIFDSGLGGLTVVQRLQELLPSERIVYLADQAHVPYGGRELEEVCGFAHGISNALLAFGCKAIVMACNISSATALHLVREANPDRPIFGVITPGAQAAAAQTHRGRIGVLATVGTVRSGAYTRALHALDPKLQVMEVACPAFVPLVENDDLDTPAALCAAHEYLVPLRDANVDTVILGCTHYPFLLSTLRQVAPELRFIDPAEQTVQELAVRLAHVGLSAPMPDSDSSPQHLLATTGDTAHFSMQMRRFLPGAEATAEVLSARWEQGILQIK